MLVGSRGEADASGWGYPAITSCKPRRDSERQRVRGRGRILAPLRTLASVVTFDSCHSSNRIKSPSPTSSLPETCWKRHCPRRFVPTKKVVCIYYRASRLGHSFILLTAPEAESFSCGSAPHVIRPFLPALSNAPDLSLFSRHQPSLANPIHPQIGAIDRPRPRR